jgi:hypothetical protein
MQFNREEKVDKEIGMYYTPTAEHPFDPLSKKQMDVWGGTFLPEPANLVPDLKNTRMMAYSDSFIKFTPYIKVDKPISDNPIESITYSKPIGPLSFLSSTVPQSPEPAFLNYLKAFSK